jgi:hypothetical protein
MSDQDDSSKFKAFDTQKDLTFKLQALATGAFSILAGLLAITDRAFDAVWLATVGFVVLGISFVAGLLGSGGLVWELQYSKRDPNLDRYRMLFLAQWITLIAGAALFAAFVVLNLPRQQSREPISEPVEPTAVDAAFQSPYAIVASNYWAGWNSGSIELAAKSEIEGAYFGLLDSRVEFKPGGYEDVVWAEGMRAEWLSLPEHLAPTKPMTAGAQLTLLSLMSDNEPLLIAQGISPDEFVLTIQRPTYQVLALAQTLAEAEGAEFISPSHIISAADKWWTTIYPLCPPPDIRTEGGLVP